MPEPRIATIFLFDSIGNELHRCTTIAEFLDHVSLPWASAEVQYSDGRLEERRERMSVLVVCARQLLAELTATRAALRERESAHGANIAAMTADWPEPAAAAPPKPPLGRGTQRTAKDLLAQGYARTDCVPHEYAVLPAGGMTLTEAQQVTRALIADGYNTACRFSVCLGENGPTCGASWANTEMGLFEFSTAPGTYSAAMADTIGWCVVALTAKKSS